MPKISSGTESDSGSTALLRGFPPVLGAAPRCLILGSMPGVASLDVAEYYAHPRNAFWRIMGDLLGAGPDLPYLTRLARLTEAGVGLWDVIGACRRRGSLDADIVADSIEANDFAALLAAQTGIRQIFFNGAAAETEFRRRVLPGLGEAGRGLLLRRLPSTSPAHAARAYPEKLAAWSVILQALPAQKPGNHSV